MQVPRTTVITADHLASRSTLHTLRSTSLGHTGKSRNSEVGGIITEDMESEICLETFRI